MSAFAAIHVLVGDFGGFPQELFDQQYPAPGAPEVARQLAAELHSPQDGSALLLDQKWGFDHGTWSVLLPMFPEASIPVMQLSMPYGLAPEKHFEMGRQLRALRDRGVLIVGSGNIVHNLRAMQRGASDNQAYDWTIQFDTEVQQRLDSGNLADLSTFLDWGPQARLAHPTHDHYLPLLYAAGAVQEGEAPRVAPSRLKRAAGARAPRTRMPLITIANSPDREAALAGLERWKSRHPSVAGLLEPADVLVDAMRGRSSTWTRIRINLRHVPEADRPGQETPDPDDDPTRAWRESRPRVE